MESQKQLCEFCLRDITKLKHPLTHIKRCSKKQISLSKSVETVDIVQEQEIISQMPQSSTFQLEVTTTENINLQIAEQLQSLIPQKYEIMANQLWKQYNCESAIDLYNAFISQASLDIIPFSIDRETATYRQNFHPQTQSREEYDKKWEGREIEGKFGLYFYNSYKPSKERFVPTKLGWMSLYDLKDTRINYHELFRELGLTKILKYSENIQDQLTILKQDFDIVKRRIHTDPAQSPIAFQNTKWIDNQLISQRKITVVTNDIINLLLDSKSHIDNVISQEISQNVLFYADIDIKQNILKFNENNSSEDRQIFVNRFIDAVLFAIGLYIGQQENQSMIKYELVGVDKLQSFHLYTDTPVRIIDIPKIRYLILDILANDYNKNELESVYDCAPYPLKPTGYKLLRFPNSIKIETKQKIVTVHYDKKTQIEGDLSRFILQPTRIRNLQIQPTIYFNNQTPWTFMYENVEPEIIEDCQRQNCGKCEYCIEEFEYLQSIQLKEQIERDNRNNQRKYRNHKRETKRLLLDSDSDVETEYISEDEILSEDDENENQSGQNINENSGEFKEWMVKNNCIESKNNLLTYTGICPLCQRIHDNLKQLTIYRTSEFVSIMCFRNTQNKKIFQMGKNGLEISDQKQLTKAWKDSIDLSKITLKDEFPPNRNDKYISYDALCCLLTFVKSAVGTGKTYQIAKAIQQFEQLHQRSAKVLFLSVRVSFSHSIVQDMIDKFGIQFSLYDQTVDPISCDKLMIQVESLPRLAQRNQSYDFVFIDEALSVLKQVDSQICSPIEILLVMQKFCTTASYVVVCDAFLTQLVVNFYISISKASSHQLIINSYQPYSQAICEFLQDNNEKRSRQRYLQLVDDKLSQGKSVFSFFDCRTSMEQIRENLDPILQKNGIKQEEVLLLHGKNLKQVVDAFDGQTKQHITQKKQIYKDIANRLSQYRLVMFTKTLTVGVDCQLEKFSVGIHYLEMQRYSHGFEVVQALHRMRQVKEQYICHVGIWTQEAKIKKHQITPYKEIKQYFLPQQIVNTFSTKMVLKEVNNIWFQFQIVVDVTSEFLRRNAIQSVASLLSSLGYKISHQKFEESGDKLISTKTKSLKFTELDQESLGICRYIYKNGTNALPFCIDTMPIEELYNVFINTQQYLQNFMPISEISDALILKNQVQGFSNGKKIIMQEQLASKLKSLNFHTNSPSKTDITTISKSIQPLLQKSYSEQTKSYRLTSQVSDLFKIQKYCAQLLFIGHARITNENGQKEQFFTNNDLSEFGDDHIKLMNNCIIECFDKQQINTISKKMILELIKSCGYDVKMFQTRINGVKSRQYTAIMNTIIPAII